ncbi:hypothetical protein GWI33_021240 [Rhynchophorus ferrugineus]|uniref:Uncharacterized protein n=1 Tax=Rhynchophorus ferrugineus TaxID=354439 RepID=A0A834M4Z5_RHYFE|nr:hypothetical protein GWI33_021240 [Rhynchophorus ferrugineus]
MGEVGFNLTIGVGGRSGGMGEGVGEMFREEEAEERGKEGKEPTGPPTRKGCGMFFHEAETGVRLGASSVDILSKLEGVSMEH